MTRNPLAGRRKAPVSDSDSDDSDDGPIAPRNRPNEEAGGAAASSVPGRRPAPSSVYVGSERPRQEGGMKALWDGFTRKTNDFFWNLSVQVSEHMDSSGTNDQIQAARAHTHTTLRNVVVAARSHVDNFASALEDAIDTHVEGLPSRPQRTRHQRRQRKGEEDIWGWFLGEMLAVVDDALEQKWMDRKDVNEPFLQLGMVAAAVMRIALRSRREDAGKLRTMQGAAFSEDDIDGEAEAVAEVRELLREVLAVRASLEAEAIGAADEEYLLRASFYAASRDFPHRVAGARKEALNGIVGSVQRVGIRLTQKDFYKQQAADIMAAMERREEPEGS